MFESIDRVYDNAKARNELGWRPKVDFASTIERMRDEEDLRSPLARAVGAKGYHRSG
jgi:nucleoside-diphosphate-sugar epimerase